MKMNFELITAAVWANYWKIYLSEKIIHYYFIIHRWKIVYLHPIFIAFLALRVFEEMGLSPNQKVNRKSEIVSKQLSISKWIFGGGQKLSHSKCYIHTHTYIIIINAF